MANCAEYVGYPQETFVPAAVREEGDDCDCDIMSGGNAWRCNGDLSKTGDRLSEKFVRADLYMNVGLEGHGNKVAHFKDCEQSFSNPLGCGT